MRKGKGESELGQESRTETFNTIVEWVSFSLGSFRFVFVFVSFRCFDDMDKGTTGQALLDTVKTEKLQPSQTAMKMEGIWPEDRQ